MAGWRCLRNTNSKRESPGSPLDLAVDNIKFDSCSLTWSPPWFDGRSPILHYTVEMRVFESDSFGHWKCCKDVIEPKASIDLVAGRQYSFRVKAANINGDGIPSPESKHITPTAMDPPTVECGTCSKHHICLSWTAPVDVDESTIHGYFAQMHRIDNEIGWIRLNNVILTHPQKDFEVSGLAAGKRYIFRIITIIDNTEYIGKETSEFTALDVPAQPLPPMVYDITCKSCSLQWETPDFDGGAALSGYEIQVQEQSSEWRSLNSYDGRTNSATITLKEDDCYTFRVLAMNKVGKGPPSLPSDNITAKGLDLHDGEALALMTVDSLTTSGMESISKSFEMGLCSLIALFEQLECLSSTVVVSEVQTLRTSLGFYAKTMYLHIRTASEKLESISFQLNQRMEAVVNQIGETERTRATHEKECMRLKDEMHCILLEINSMQEEMKNAERQYKEALDALEGANQQLENSKRNQNIVKGVGYASVLIPYVNIVAAPILLGIAYTTLEKKVTIAKQNTEKAREERDNQTEIIERKKKTADSCKEQVSEVERKTASLEKRIQSLKQSRTLLQDRLKQQTELSTNMRKCTLFVGGATDKAEVLQSEMQFLYDISSVFVPLKDLAQHLSLPEASKLGLLSEKIYIETAALKLKMLADIDSNWNTSNLPDYQKDLKVVPATHKEKDTIAMIDDISTDITANILEDRKLIMLQHADCETFLGSAPSTVALLGHLTIFALKKDFEIGGKEQGRNAEKMQWSNSFRASMLQATNAGWKAFYVAQRSMDQIRGYASTIPGHLKNAQCIINTGSNNEARHLLKGPLTIIRHASEKCLEQAKKSQNEFHMVIKLMNRLQEACVMKRSESETRHQDAIFEMEEAKIEASQQEKETEILEDKIRRDLESLQNAQRKFNESLSSLPSTGHLMCMAAAETAMNTVSATIDTILKPINFVKSKKGESNRQSLECAEGPQMSDFLAEADEESTCVGKVSDASPVYDETDKEVYGDTEVLGAHIDLVVQNFVNDELQKPEVKNLSDRKCIKSCIGKFKKVRETLSAMKFSCSVRGKALDLCAEGVAICKELKTLNKSISSNPKKKTELAKSILNLQEKINEYCLEGHNALTSKHEGQIKNQQPMKSLKTEKGYVQYEFDKVREKVDKTSDQLKKAKIEYEKSCEKARNKRAALSRTLRKNTKINMKKVEFEKIINLLCECLKQFGQLKIEWGKLVQFFQSMSSIIEISLNDNLKSFIELTGTTNTNGQYDYKISSMQKELLYQQIGKASEIAYYLSFVTESYVDVSRKFFMPVIEKLPELMKLDPEEHHIEMKAELRKLETECKTAQEQIDDYMTQKTMEFENAFRTRLSAFRQLELKVQKTENAVSSVDTDYYA